MLDLAKDSLAGLDPDAVSAFIRNNPKHPELNRNSARGPKNALQQFLDILVKNGVIEAAVSED